MDAYDCIFDRSLTFPEIIILSENKALKIAAYPPFPTPQLTVPASSSKTTDHKPAESLKYPAPKPNTKAYTNNPNSEDHINFSPQLPSPLADGPTNPK